MAKYDDTLNFYGVLTMLDEPSVLPLSGASGKRVILPRSVAEDALATLVGKPVNRSLDWKNHDKNNPIGKIIMAWIDGFALCVGGYIYQDKIQKAPRKLGMSFELADTTIIDYDAMTWKVINTTFDGAAIIMQSKAAYKHTSFSLERRRKCPTA